MIINNQKVQGIFIYTPESANIEFTKNDLVVSGDSIYICMAESVSGIDPATDKAQDYYKPYPGDKIITASEFFRYVDDVKRKIEEGVEDPEQKADGADSYVSVQAISGILQGYQFGLDMTGVITDWIDKNGDTTLTLSQPTDRPLDNLMLTETLNRGMIKVSHELSQIVDGTDESGVGFSTMFGFLDKNGIDYSIILSQYTYKSSETVWMRVQEMMSPLTGVSVYRYMSWTNGNFPSDGSVISSWRNVFSYSSAIQSKMNALQEYYGLIAQQNRSRLNSTFRFREVYDGGTRGTAGTGRSDLEEGVYTVCLRGLQAGDEELSSIYKTESVVVRLKNGMSSYRISLNTLEGFLRITSNSITASGRGLEIISIYCRES